jgi:hypothetical protein
LKIRRLSLVLVCLTFGCTARNSFLLSDVPSEPSFVGPEDCPEIGNACDDGTVFAGFHPASGGALFVHPLDTRWVQWSSIVNVTGATNEIDGQANQTQIESTVASLSEYPAFALCNDANQNEAYGHRDWYLPAIAEAMKLRWHRDALNSGLAEPIEETLYWASNERSEEFAGKQGFVGNDFSSSGNQKVLQRSVRCIRRDDALSAPIHFCPPGSACLAIGDTYEDGSIFVGWHPEAGEPLFLHPDEQGTAIWSSEAALTGAVDPADGRINQAWIELNKDLSDYPAFRPCRDLNVGLTDNLQRTDWYLPSVVEMNLMWVHWTTISDAMTTGSFGGLSWSSTQVDEAQANRQDWSGTFPWDKTTGDNSRIYCMRRGY